MANSIKNNSFSVEIKNGNEWEPISGKPIFPLSRGELLDERLDEAYLTLVDDTRESYSPLTELRIKSSEVTTSFEEQEKVYNFEVFVYRSIKTGYVRFPSLSGNAAFLEGIGVFEYDVSVQSSNIPRNLIKLEIVPRADDPNVADVVYTTDPAYYRKGEAPTQFELSVAIFKAEQGAESGENTYQSVTVPINQSSLRDVSRITYVEYVNEIYLGYIGENVEIKGSSIVTTKYPDNIPPTGHSKIDIVQYPYIDNKNLMCHLEATYNFELFVEDGIQLSNFPKSLIYGVQLTVTVFNAGSLSDTGYLFYVVGRDDSTRNPLTGKWKHSLYLLERTKLLEGIVCPSLTFTNVGGAAIRHSIVGEGQYLSIKYDNDVFQGESEELKNQIGKTYPASHNEYPISAHTFVEHIRDVYNSKFAVDTFFYKTRYEINTSVHPGQNWPEIVVVETANGTETYSGANDVKTLFSEIKSLIYYGSIRRFLSDELGDATDTPLGLGITRYVIQYDVATEEFKVLPSKKLTVTDCINRVLDLAEPLFTGEIGGSSRALPRYSFRGILRDSSGHVSGYLKGSQAEKYSKIIAPEFSMTECTLREQLKIIGSYIHAEPRLDENDEIYFEEYGEVADAGISDKPYIYSGSSWDVNDYCTEIKSNAKNLTSSLSYASTDCFDPARTMYRSLRSEVQYARVTTDNAIIMTEFPIYAVKKVMCGILIDDAEDTTNDTAVYWLSPVDISGFVFESTFYNANLSAYASEGANSRNLALFYKQGESGIRGLFYRSPTTAENTGKFSNYSITSILNLAKRSGKTLEQIKTKIEGTDDNPTGGIGRLVFQVSYVPIYSVTASHGKAYHDITLPRFSKVYNQSEQLVESSYYGENVKGVAQRLGNVEKERTFIVKSVKDIPKTGQMLEGFAISAVSSEINPYYIKCTVGLTKDFNRISEYIGISSIRRMYEISERNVSDRNVFIHNTVLIGDEVPGASKTDRAIYRETDMRIATVFTGFPSGDTDAYLLPISYAVAQCFPKNNPGNNGAENEEAFNLVLLPVIPTALGNSMIFSFSFKDNYSAGSRTQWVDTGEAIGYWQDDVPYTDLTGKAYWLKFGFSNGSSGPENGITNPLQIPLAIETTIENLPVTNKISNNNFRNLCVLGGNQYPLLLQKDNREKISLTYEIEFKSNRNDIIIGSALASSNPLVKDITISGLGEARIVYFDTAPSKFTSRLDVTIQDPLISTCCMEIPNTSGTDTMYLYENDALKDKYIPTGDDSVVNETCKYQFGAPRNIKGFAIVTSPNEVTSTVVDEDGVETQQTINYGGEVLLMRIADIKAGEPLFGRDDTGKPRKIYFNVLPN